MSNLLDNVIRQFHVRNPVILGNETTAVSFTETDMFNIMRLCITDKVHDCFLDVRLERKEYLQIIKHGIAEFGFTASDLINTPEKANDAIQELMREFNISAEELES